jgi:hypothetical protein
MMKCDFCGSEKVVVNGRNCHCTDCEISWKEPVYERSLYPLPSSSILVEVLADHKAEIPWAIVIVLSMACLYLWILLNQPLIGVG